MAKLTGPLLSGSASGTIGGALDYFALGARAVARSIARRRFAASRGIKPTPSAAQLARRAQWLAGIAGWHALTPEQQAQYNTAAHPLGLTGYNLYQREYTATGDTAWDGGASVWDNGLTTWDN